MLDAGNSNFKGLVGSQTKGKVTFEIVYKLRYVCYRYVCLFVCVCNIKMNIRNEDNLLHSNNITSQIQMIGHFLEPQCVRRQLSTSCVKTP